MTVRKPVASLGPLLLFASIVLNAAGAVAQTAGSDRSANRLTYIDEFLDPYYVSGSFPKLTTPQWVGEEGVEAVVVLAIDDMRDTKRYEQFLRPILDRLKQIDGRAPVSIMTNRADPKDPQLAKWIAEGLNIDVHTFDHPCPCLQKGDFAQARRTYEQCVDLMASIPNNRPVAFRMPCCDSLNTPSPRFWTEIFNKTTTSGGRLVIDSSVFNIVTPQDKSLPAEWTLLDGGERFRRYIPFPSFVNTIENYPYPYLIGRQCWEFPCVVPSDWEAQNIQQSNNPATVRDMKIALDVTVKKQGVYNLVFHPHSWIRNDQVIQLIDHAQQKYGDKVKFLSFREAAERLEKSLLSGQPLRDASGAENGVRLLDLNADGYLDVVIGNRTTRLSRVWSPADMRWIDSVFPADIRGGATRFGVIDGRVVAIQSAGETRGAWAFDNGRWTADRRLLAGLEADGAAISTIRDGLDRGVRLRDLDNDGRCELLVSNDQQNIVFHWSGQRWRRATYRLPPGMEVVDDRGRDAGLRFVDINEDGFADAIFSNEQRYALHLWNGRKPASGWSIEALRGDRTDDGAIPMIARQGRNNGAWFHSRSMWIQNEDTSRLPDLVDRRSFAQLLEKHHGDQPPPKTIQQSLRTFEFPPDLQLELVAAEPLIADPVAFDWSPDGSLWVAEMGDYPLGVDGFGKPGGRVRRLTDTDGDGVYDQSELFLDGVRFPTGVKVWRNGVLVSTAPDLFYAEDTDGDGRADKRQILFTGFVEGNQQHRVNGLRWGLDNWLYLANGDSGGEIKSTQTGKVLNIRGRDLRVRPDTGEMNALAGQTQFGRNRDDWGNWFGGNNSNPMWHYVLEDYVTRRNPLLPTPDVRRAVSVQPGAAPVFPSSRTLTRFNDFDRVDRFTSACSPIIYRDAWLGDSYRGNAFIAEPVHNLVHREIVEAVGDSFTSHRAERDRNNEFLRSRDNWFRPTMVRTGPDGSLWIADMYRLVIEHPKWIPQEWQRRLDLRSGSDRGRIYRLKPRGKTTPPAAGRALRGLQPNDLVAELSSGNGWRRDMAQQLIVLSQDRKYIVPLEQLAAASKLPLARLHALCALDSFGPPRAEVLLPRLNDSHPGVRRHAVRIAGLHATTDERVVAALAKLADTETDARVQIEIAVALGSIRQEAAGAALGRLTARMRPHQFRFTAALSSIDEDNIGDVIAAALGTDEAAMNPELVEPLLTLAGAMGNREIVNDLLSSWLGSAQPLTQKAATLAAVFELNLTGPTMMSERLAKRVRELIAQSRVALQRASPEESASLVRLLGFDHRGRDGTLPVLLPLLAPQHPPELQHAAGVAVVRLAANDSVRLLLPDWPTYSPALRQHLLDLLLAQPKQTELLLRAVAAKQAPLSIFDARRRTQLSQHKSPTVSKLANQLFQTSLSVDRQAVLKAYEGALKQPGDAQRGRAVFEKSCANCHRLQDLGHPVGPDLAAITNRTSPALLKAVLDPNRAIESKFLDFLAATNDGRQFSGILTTETSTDITLTGQQGKRFVILRKDLDELKSTGKSFMPVGLEKDIPPPAMADLIAFLQTSGPPPKKFPGNEPRTVAADADGTVALSPKTARIYGPNIQLETEYGNLGFWGSDQERAVWSVDSAGGDFAVMIDYACPPDTAGDAFRIEFQTAAVAGPPPVTGAVRSTGSWTNYRMKQVGVVKLPPGRLDVVVRSNGPVRGFLWDLRSVRLKPAK